MTMQITIPRETRSGETRVALIPEDVQKLTKTGIRVKIEQGAGDKAGYTNEDYLKAGATIVTVLNDTSLNDLERLFHGSDIVLRVKRAARDREIIENQVVPKQAVILGFLDPLDGTTPHVKEWVDRSVLAITLDQLPLENNDPRNVLAAMSAIAGRLAVKDAIEKHKLSEIKKAVVIGTGSSGLSAIDMCLSNKFKTIVIGTSTGQKDKMEKNGAIFMVLDTKKSEKEQQDQICGQFADADIVITTARRAGQKAPLLINEDTLRNMKPGSVLVDLALTEGGNVAGSENDKTKVLDNGVIITNSTGYPKQDPLNASKAFSLCLYQLISDLAKDAFSLKNPLIDAAFVCDRNGALNPKIFKA